MKTRLLSLVAGAAMALSVTSLRAQVIYLYHVDTDPSNINVIVDASPDTFSGSITSGILQFKSSATGLNPLPVNASVVDFESFCLEAKADLQGLASYDKHGQWAQYTLAGPASIALQRLYGYVFSGTYDLSLLDSTSGPYSGNEKKAAFQLAVWELALDPGDASHSLTTGTFRAHGTYDHAIDAVALANSWITSALAQTTTIPLVVMHNDTYQDLLQVVPEPGTWAAIFGVASLGVVLIRRRIRSRADR